MWYHHFGADGAAAAQKWARLMGEQKEKELEEHYSTEELEGMAPRERAVLFWYVTTNCTMHNFHLGGKYAAKAARDITTERTKPAVEALREAGHKSDHFNLCPTCSRSPGVTDSEHRHANGHGQIPGGPLDPGGRLLEGD